MNKFRELGLIDYNGHIEVHSSLLNVVLHDQPQIRRWDGWCRSTRISASSSARDRKSLAKAHKISLQRSIIARKHQPIRAGLPAGLGFR
jgi:hypothetical protein